MDLLPSRSLSSLFLCGERAFDPFGFGTLIRRPILHLQLLPFSKLEITTDNLLSFRSPSPCFSRRLGGINSGF
jgi:hypothetical protein